MLERYETIGITSDKSKSKLAAILFDKVCSLVEDHDIPTELRSPIPLNFIDLKNIQVNLAEKNTNSNDILIKEFETNYLRDFKDYKREVLEGFVGRVKNEAKAEAYNSMISESAKKLSIGKTIGIPIFNETILKTNIEENIKKSIIDKVEVEIINAPIIIASDLEWDQIIEAKKDTNFNNKVKRFSVFINKNYKGRDLSYIIDDLTLQIEDYKSACNKHGIKLANETFKSLANSKSTFGTLGLAFLALLAKMPEYAAVSGVIGAVLEVLNLKIAVRQVQDNYQDFVNDSPIALIFDIEKMKTKSS